MKAKTIGIAGTEVSCPVGGVATNPWQFGCGIIISS